MLFTMFTSWFHLLLNNQYDAVPQNESEAAIYYKKDLDVLLEGITDPIKKIALIFNHVKAKVKWNDYHGIYTSDGVKKAYKDHVGNVAEINLMLTSMLRYA